MHQVIMNLCTNAYQSMREKGGVLTVTLREDEIFKNNPTNRIPGPYIMLEIKDTGHGMDRHTLEKAFDPYFTTKEVGKGTGFGLALVQAIVDEHDGYVHVQSMPGHGSSFQVYLPVDETGTDTQTEIFEEEIFFKGTERIMVVDDEESIRVGTCDFLEDCGYRVSAFQDGEEAFEAFKTDPYRFDLIVTDMTMPRMTGDKLSVKMLAIRKDLPIILCTGYSEHISETRAMEIGIRKYVQKPILLPKLAALMRELIDGTSPPSGFTIP
jgi:CheY-like chemotaxis protein/anti-sigma regulatory factor (Ser/Thr protein kinase)